MNIQQLRLQKFGATSDDIALSRNTFPFTQRPSELTPYDFFLWGYLQLQIYQHNRITIPQLKEEIRIVIAQLEENNCPKVIINLIDRVATCKASHGGHMPDVVYIRNVFICNGNMYHVHICTNTYCIVVEMCYIS